MPDLTCHDCGTTWEAKRARTCKDGLYRCKPCGKKVINRKWEDKNPEYQKHYSKENAEKRSANSSKWNKANPIKRRKIEEKYRATDHGKKAARVRGRRYYQNHTEELLEKSRTRYYQLTPHMERMLKDDPCAICGSYDDPTLDHMWPRAKGGEHINGNMQILCRSCNSFKKDRIFLADNQGWIVGL